MAENKFNNSDKLLGNLFKKWELYWNHYKLQHEAYERRRYLIWLIQSALAIAWYKTFFDCHTLFPLVISFFTTIFSLLWFFMCRRERESIFFTEEQLRDIEDEINSINTGIKVNYFKLRKIVLGPEPPERNSLREDFFNKLKDYWNFKSTSINIISKYLNSFYCNREIKSVKFVLDFFVPLVFFIIWGIILIYTIIKISIAIRIIGTIILLLILFLNKDSIIKYFEKKLT